MVSTQYRIQGRTAKQIADSLESGIRGAALTPDALLPSVRALAGELDVAAGTVAAAYRLLRERGLVEARGRHGTRVRRRPPLASRSAGPLIQPGVLDLASGQPDPRLLPALESMVSSSRWGPAAAPTAPVLPQLLALGRKRLAADAVPVTALTVTSGGLDAIHRLLAAQLRPGDTVAVEDPGWPNVLDLLATLGLRARPMPLDSAGPLPQPLRALLGAGAQAVIITNRAQNPTGVALTHHRADELRRVLSDYPHAFVIEDDHAAELVDIKLATLAGATPSWAFVRSTSKPYGPDLRVALIAGDDATIARVEGRLRIGSGWVSTLLQRLTVELWTNPKVESIVAHAAQSYTARRQQLIDELAQRGIAATGDTGLNVWIPVTDETSTVAALLSAGWAVAPGARFRQASHPGVRITVSALTPATIPQLADHLAEAITDRPPGPYTT